jgi:benzoate membrane transport protein
MSGPGAPAPRVAAGRSLVADFSLPALVAGFVTVLVGYTSSAAIVFQATQALGASPAQVASWMWALGLGMGLTCIALSLRYRVPVVTAWSTPGAAMLITSAAGVPMAEAIGGFVVCAVLMTLAGFTGAFERAMNRLPLSLASGMLAGVLLRFGLDVFGAMQTELALVLPMFVAYLALRRLRPRYAVVGALALGVAIAGARGALRLDAVELALTTPLWTTPRVSIAALFGIALPLFVVTMASQNIPGVAVMRASGFHAPVSPLVGWTGAATLLLAPFVSFFQ